MLTRPRVGLRGQAGKERVYRDGAMPARRKVPVSRALFTGAALVALAPGCSGAPPVPAPVAASPCASDHLDACERSLAAAPTRPLAAAYAAARAARDPGDAWARLYRDLDGPDRGPRPRAVLVAEGGAVSLGETPKPAARPAPAASGLRAITAASLPAPAALDADDLLLALATAAGYTHVIRVRGGAVTQLFPGDPLAPFMGGLRPALRGGAATASLEPDLAAEEALRAAFEAAAGFHYVEAARAAEKLSALLEKRDPYAEPVLRWEYALQLLGSAGLVLDADETAASATPSTPSATPPPAPEPPPLGPDETPYASYLRVMTAKEMRKEWDARGARVLPAIRADRREAFASMFAHGRESCETRRAPPMEGTRDLVFANKLSGALPRDPTAALAAGQLPLREWLERYRTMVDLVDQTRSAWSYLPSLLVQRGEAPGLSAAATPVYRRVTELGLAHLAATKALEEAYPVRYRSFTQLGMALSPGLMADDKLRAALSKLAEASVQDKLAAAKDAEGLLLGLVTGAAAGLSYPPALQGAHFLAMSGAVTARLKGDFLQKTGWGVALLYAIDAVYRVAADQGPNFAFSSAQVARALGAPSVEHPALASLATAAARYAALAADHKLEGTARDKFPPERSAAMQELRAALAGLGAPGEAPGNVLDDVTTLTDGLVATLSTAIAAGTAKKPPPKPGTCARKAAAVPLDPTLRRTLARLGDVRRRILSHPRYKEGDGLWVRRVRLLVTVLSDAMDVAIGSDAQKKPAFVVPPAEAQKVIEAALREIDQKAVTDVVSGGYGLFRELTALGDPEQLLKKSSRDLGRVASGLITLFRGDVFGGKGPAMGVAFLDALAGLRFDAPSSDDPMATLAAYATAFYAKKQPDQGDLCLLAGLVLSSLTGTRPSPAILALAARNDSRVAWLLRFSQEVHRSAPGDVPDPTVYAEGMRRATDDACQAPDAEATLAVTAAIHDYAGGKKKEARAALDRVLENADDRGLGVPRMAYRYEEKTATKVFMINVDLSYGNGILSGGNTFQLGLGVRGAGEPGGSLTSTLAPLDTGKAGEDAARYYVYTAALATVYHLLDGDTEHAVATGRRAVVALETGLKLGTRALRPDKPASWGDDSREVLVLAAQLAAEAGLPFLAGDLWTVVRHGFSDTLDDKGVAALLDRPTLGLLGVKELKPVTERARRSLKVLAEPLPCTDAKVELGGFEEVACADYPLALSLRIADALKKLPRLRRGAEANPHCGPLKSLDAFLAGGDKGAYDPDAFTRAEEELRADGKIYDAAILLTRQKHPSHCNPTLVVAARALGRSPILGPWIRSDLLGAAVNCTAVAGGPEVEADLARIDEDTRRLPDPARNLRMVLSVAELATRTDQWGMLTRLVDKPDFVGRWMSIHPNAAAAALLLDHAVTAIGGQPVALERTRGSYELLCETFKSEERADICGTLAALRAPLAGPMAERQRMAKEAVKKLTASASPPPAKKP